MTGFDARRRVFLQVSVAAGGALLVGVCLPRRTLAAAQAAEFAPNAWVRIDSDSRVTVMVDKSEMGQGVATALPMLVAEELEVPLKAVGFQFAPVAEAYTNPLLRVQGTGGSTSIRASWRPLREAGAAARTLLIAAAAQRWGIPPAECVARGGFVERRDGGARYAYGELAALAATLPVPDTVALKPRSAQRLIGTPAARLDVPAKVDGSARFGMDVRLPGMLYAAIAHAPVFGARLAGFDAGRAQHLPGVRTIVGLDAAVAVVADSYWQARRGLDAVDARWTAVDGLSSEAILTAMRERAGEAGKVALERGDPARVMADAAGIVTATYTLPFLAHATMEPMNCTAHVRPDGCDIWVPTQGQSAAQEVAARVTGLDYARIKIHTTYLGGGFGRRSESDFVEEAVRVSMQAGAPVQLIWSREEDTRHDYYRPANVHVLQAALDGRGGITAWTQQIVCPSIMARAASAYAPLFMPQWLPYGLKGFAANIGASLTGLTVDRTAVEGADTLPYAIDNVRVDYVRHDTPVPVGFWRSVGHSHTAFAIEGFIDELAAAARTDPYRFRRALLRDAPRHLGVLDLAANKAGWDRPPPAGRYRGIAVHASYGSYVAQVVEASVEHGDIRVHRVVCAVDCGVVVNPDIVHAQMESGIVFGLSAALSGEITIKDGRVQQSNFHDYPVLRLSQMPSVEVYIVPSEEDPGGIGEPATPVIAPALAAAVARATGKSIRRLPLRVPS